MHSDLPGLLTFFLMPIWALVFSWVFMQLFNLSKPAWIAAYTIALAVSLVGVALLFKAKLPLYRRHRFFEFGSKSLPPSSVPYYRWAYRILIPSILFMGLLLLFAH
jgi:hypothetical protein